MAIPRFYVEKLAGPSLRLSEREAGHAARSRRLAPGDEIMLFDGAGNEAPARIAAVNRSAVDVAPAGIVHRPRPVPALTLAVALPKGPRQDVLIEKCTELGLAALIPLITDRSISGTSDHKLDRWRQTAIEAAKQSAQAWLPQFHPPEPLPKALERIHTHDLSVVAAQNGDALSFPLETGTQLVSVLAFIGPEGGWTDQELDVLTAAGCSPVSLGPNILRVETAAIALAAIVHLAQNEMRTTKPPESWPL